MAESRGRFAEGFRGSCVRFLFSPFSIQSSILFLVPFSGICLFTQDPLVRIFSVNQRLCRGRWIKPLRLILFCPGPQEVRFLFPFYAIRFSCYVPSSVAPDCLVRHLPIAKNRMPAYSFLPFCMWRFRPERVAAKRWVSRTLDFMCFMAQRGSYVTCIGVPVVIYILCPRCLLPAVVLSFCAGELGDTMRG